MLQSPRFIYRVEKQVADGKLHDVSPFELASRLSYSIWGGPPDDELFKAAKADRLKTEKQVSDQVRRMLRDKRAKRQSERFADQWLNLNRLRNMQPSEERFPDWNRDLADDMRRETLSFFRHVVWDQNRPLADLLSAQVSFMTPRLAEHYGIEDLPGGDADRPDSIARVDLSETPQRGGLLTHGSVLTIGGDEASMVTRGLFILNDLLFSRVGDPPPGLDTTPVPPSPGRSHRAIAMERVRNVSCGGCHAKFEPLAFGLERYDGLGRYRLVDHQGNDNREDGEILFPGDAEPVKYESSAEMMQLLASSDRVAKGMTRKITQFTLGRPLVLADMPSVDQIHRRAGKNGGTYAATIEAVSVSDLMRKQKTFKNERNLP